MKTKLKPSDLKVTSFVTSLTVKEQQTINGGVGVLPYPYDAAPRQSLLLYEGCRDAGLRVAVIS